MSPTVWWIIGIIVALAIIALIIRSASARRVEAHREQAAGIREEAADTDRALRARQASADEAEAQSRRAQAEADEAAARAEQLRVESERREQAAAEVRNTRDEHLRRADALDPDVRTDKEGYRLDDDGARLATSAPVARASGAEPEPASTGTGAQSAADSYAATRDSAGRLDDSAASGASAASGDTGDSGDNRSQWDTADRRSDPSRRATADGSAGSNGNGEAQNLDDRGTAQSGWDTDQDWTGRDGAADVQPLDDRPTLGEKIRAEADAKRGANDSPDGP